MKILKGVMIMLLLTTALSPGFPILASGQDETGHEDGAVQGKGELYLPSSDALGDVDRAMNIARDSNKRLLVVMGANWCHDSRALASRLYEEPLQSLVRENYVTVFVDVGYLDQGKEVISSFGPPVYYATPTVLIVDPPSGELINARNRHQWGDASRISMEASLDYFRQMASMEPGTDSYGDVSTEDLHLALGEIQAWEQIQADRLYAAYAVIGPLLKAYKNGQTSEHFEDYWNEARDFRVSLALALEVLRQEARALASVGESPIRLDYPEYPPFSWETPAP